MVSSDAMEKDSTTLTIKKILEDIVHSDLKSIKETTSEIIRIIDDPRFGAKDLKDVIEMDPLLTAKLLKLANSAYYGFSRTIATVLEAVVCIGFDTVKELALSQTLGKIFNNSVVKYGYSRKLLWKHCLAVALFSKIMFVREFRQAGDKCYVVGLLHELGIITLEQLYPDIFNNILKNAEEKQINVFESEMEILGFNHTDIGRAILSEWALPEYLVEAVGHHHEPEKVEDDYYKVTSTLFIADVVIADNKIGYIDNPKKDIDQFKKHCRKLNDLTGSKIDETSIDLIIGELEKQMTAMEKAGWF